MDDSLDHCEQELGVRAAAGRDPEREAEEPSSVSSGKPFERKDNDFEPADKQNAGRHPDCRRAGVLLHRLRRAPEEEPTQLEMAPAHRLKNFHRRTGLLRFSCRNSGLRLADTAHEGPEGRTGG